MSRRVIAMADFFACHDKTSTQMFTTCNLKKRQVFIDSSCSISKLSITSMSKTGSGGTIVFPLLAYHVIFLC